MILQKLEIELERWGANKGKYTGSARFSGDAGDVTLNLNHDHIEEIFRTCADSIIETSKAAARHLTHAVIEHQKTVEAKKGIAK
jgi:hypothetical protein